MTNKGRASACHNQPLSAPRPGKLKLISATLPSVTQSPAGDLAVRTSISDADGNVKWVADGRGSRSVSQDASRDTQEQRKGLWRHEVGAREKGSLAVPEGILGCGDGTQHRRSGIEASSNDMRICAGAGGFGAGGLNIGFPAYLTG